MNKQNITLEEIERHLEEIRKENNSFGAKAGGFFKVLLQLSILPLLVYLVFAFLLGVAQVQQASMSPNFSEGDFVIFNRLETDYSFGDVVIAFNAEQEETSILRIIGVPGDTIQITTDHKIMINGEVIRESWQTEGTLTQGEAYIPITLHENEYFVLGDNRNDSIDSRSDELGNVHKDDILGIVVYRFKMSK